MLTYAPVLPSCRTAPRLSPTMGVGGRGGGRLDGRRYFFGGLPQQPPRRDPKHNLSAMPPLLSTSFLFLVLAQLLLSSYASNRRFAGGEDGRACALFGSQRWQRRRRQRGEVGSAARTARGAVGAAGSPLTQARFSFSWVPYSRCRHRCRGGRRRGGGWGAADEAAAVTAGPALLMRQPHDVTNQGVRGGGGDRGVQRCLKQSRR